MYYSRIDKKKVYYTFLKEKRKIFLLYDSYSLDNREIKIAILRVR